MKKVNRFDRFLFTVLTFQIYFQFRKAFENNFLCCSMTRQLLVFPKYKLFVPEIYWFIYYGIVILRCCQHEYCLKDKNFSFDIVDRSRVYEKISNTTAG